VQPLLAFEFQYIIEANQKEEEDRFIVKLIENLVLLA